MKKFISLGLVLIVLLMTVATTYAVIDTQELEDMIPTTDQRYIAHYEIYPSDITPPSEYFYSDGEYTGYLSQEGQPTEIGNGYVSVRYAGWVCACTQH